MNLTIILNAVQFVALAIEINEKEVYFYTLDIKTGDSLKQPFIICNICGCLRLKPEQEIEPESEEKE